MTSWLDPSALLLGQSGPIQGHKPAKCTVTDLLCYPPCGIAIRLYADGFCRHAGIKSPKRLTEVVKVIDLARANNVSIMLTQFQAFKGGALEVRHAVLTGSKLGLERLSLLMQVWPLLRQRFQWCTNLKSLQLVVPDVDGYAAPSNVGEDHSSSTCWHIWLHRSKHQPCRCTDLSLPPKLSAVAVQKQ